LAVSAPVVCEPLTGSLPFQPPEAVQALALLELQFRLTVLPEFTVLGFAVKVTDGAPPASFVEPTVCAPLGLGATESAGSGLTLC
jgi:hypothetical protein